jgi:hypothetical protein
MPGGIWRRYDGVDCTVHFLSKAISEAIRDFGIIGLKSANVLRKFRME